MMIKTIYNYLMFFKNIDNEFNFINSVKQYLYILFYQLKYYYEMYWMKAFSKF